MMNTDRLHTNPLSNTNPIRDFIPPLLRFSQYRPGKYSTSINNPDAATAKVPNPIRSVGVKSAPLLPR